MLFQVNDIEKFVAPRMSSMAAVISRSNGILLLDILRKTVIWYAEVGMLMHARLINGKLCLMPNNHQQARRTRLNPTNKLIFSLPFLFLFEPQHPHLHLSTQFVKSLARNRQVGR
jgi:hypothetical protein